MVFSIMSYPQNTHRRFCTKLFNGTTYAKYNDPIQNKTTSVHALARQLLGPSYSAGVLELNASDARGIDVVRSKIKGFAMNKVNLPQGR